MRKIEIRSARAGEAEAGASLQLACWRANFRGLVSQAALDAIDPVAWAERRRAAWSDPARVVLVAEGAEGLLGFCEGGEPRDPRFKGMGEVHALFVAPEGQGGGVGAALWRAMREELRLRGYQRIMVKTLATNPGSRAFYERQGGRLSELGSSFEFGGRAYPEAIYLYEA